MALAQTEEQEGEVLSYTTPQPARDERRLDHRPPSLTGQEEDGSGTR